MLVARLRIWVLWRKMKPESLVGPCASRYDGFGIFGLVWSMTGLMVEQIVAGPKKSLVSVVLPAVLVRILTSHILQFDGALPAIASYWDPHAVHIGSSCDTIISQKTCPKR